MYCLSNTPLCPLMTSGYTLPTPALLSSSTSRVAKPCFLFLQKIKLMIPFIAYSPQLLAMFLPVDSGLATNTTISISVIPVPCPLDSHLTNESIFHLTPADAILLSQLLLPPCAYTCPTSSIPLAASIELKLCMCILQGLFVPMFF